ncbi:MAG: TldD/PmbA family protein [Rhodospirillaceae bacterium]
MSESTPAAADALSLLEDVVRQAQAKGASAADALMVDGTSLSVSYRQGELEDLKRAESKELGLRVFVGQRQAVVSTGDLQRDALEAVVERAVAMAKAVPEDPHCGLADPDQLAKTLPEIDGYDDYEPSEEQLKTLALSCEDAARAVEGVTNSDGGEAGWGRSLVAGVGSNGFAHAYWNSHSSFGVSVIAGSSADGMESDYDYSTAVFFDDLKDAEEIGRSAGQRAVRRLGAERLKTGKLPIVFEPRMARGLVGSVLGGINGSSIVRGTSFLKDSLGETVFGENVTIREDPHRPRGPRSRPCDAEGLANKARALIDKGQITTWLLDLRSARHLGMESTGHAGRGISSQPSPTVTNVWLEPGTVSPAALMADIEDGLYLTDLFGQGLNMITGDYSRGAAGFRIQNGEITTPVNEITIAGNLKDMLNNMTPADDLEMRWGTDAPTLRIDGMTIAGA